MIIILDFDVMFKNKNLNQIFRKFENLKKNMNKLKWSKELRDSEGDKRI